MDTMLTASSTTAGALMSQARFRVPNFQREYAWENHQVSEFFDDLSQSLDQPSYFLGLIIVTGENDPKNIVDGQQRLLTLTLLASALYHQTKVYERRALTHRIESTFLRSIDFESDAEVARLSLSSDADDATLQLILENPANQLNNLLDDDLVSNLLMRAYQLVSERLEADLSPDPFKRLGLWAEFLFDRLTFAVFAHPDPGAAYRVFEVVNSRGKELTTADLLKSYVLGETKQTQRDKIYAEWQQIARSFTEDSQSTFVQFIRHAVTTERGYVLARDLYDELAARGRGKKSAMTPDHLIALLRDNLQAYLQLMDPTQDGPADNTQLAIFSVLNSLGVVSVRPILLALLGAPDATNGMKKLLRLVVRRIVVGNLGTGAVERRFGRVAQQINRDGDWEQAFELLEDLNHEPDEFNTQIQRRPMNRGLMTILRRSVLQQTITPDPDGYLYFIVPRNALPSADEDERAVFLSNKIGNSFLASESRRPTGSSSWQGFKDSLLPYAVDGEWADTISDYPDWNSDAIAEVGKEIADDATDIWYR